MDPKHGTQMAHRKHPPPFPDQRLWPIAHMHDVRRCRTYHQNAPQAPTDLLIDNGWRTELGSHMGVYPFKLTRDMLDVSRSYYKKYLANQGSRTIISIP